MLRVQGCRLEEMSWPCIHVCTCRYICRCGHIVVHRRRGQAHIASHYHTHARVNMEMRWKAAVAGVDWLAQCRVYERKEEWGLTKTSGCSVADGEKRSCDSAVSMMRTRRVTPSHLAYQRGDAAHARTRLSTLHADSKDAVRGAIHVSVDRGACGGHGAGLAQVVVTLLGHGQNEAAG